MYLILDAIHCRRDRRRSDGRPNSRCEPIKGVVAWRGSIDPKIGRWDGIFPSITMCMSLGVGKLTNNDCLPKSDSMFILTDLTMNKLGEGRDKQMRFMFQMIELFYMPLMGGNAIIDNIHFKRYLELLNGTTWLSETRTYPKRPTSGQRGGWKFATTYLINNFRH